MANQYSGELSKKVLELAARPDGMRTDQIEGYTIAQVARIANKLQTAGLLFAAKFSHKRVVYFTDADRAIRATGAPSFHGDTPGRGVKPTDTWAKAAPIIPPGVKYMAFAAPPPRFQVVDLPTVKPPCTSRAGSEDFRKHQRHGRF